MKLKNNMKTIEEAAINYCSETEENGYKFTLKSPFDSFKAGAIFAQQFYPIERDKDGFTTLKQDEEFQKNFPILVKGNYGIELINELTSDLNRQSYGYAHWRPVNLK